MTLLSRLERRLEDVFEGFFSRRFSGRVHPMEIARRLGRAMEDGSMAAVSHVYAPNLYRVYLHPDDFEPLSSVRGILTRELMAYLRNQIEEGGLRLPGPMRVTLEVHQDVPSGQVLVNARLVDDVALADVAEERERRHASDGTDNGSGLARGSPGGTAIGVPTGEEAPRSGQGERGTAVADAKAARDETKVFSMPRPVQAELFVRDGADAGLQLLLTRAVMSIGRRADCDLVLQDPLVSRAHARLEAMPQGYLLVDLGSTNGTLVNGRRVDRHPLVDGDMITIGRTSIQFRRYGPSG